MNASSIILFKMELGAILQITQIVAYIIVGLVFVIMIKADIKIVKHDLNVMKVRQDSFSESVKQLTLILTSVAVQDNRINAVEEDIRELRHGKGFVNVDGEYLGRGKVK